MAQIFYRPSFGETFGTALGTGLGEGLQTLAQQKLNQISRRETFNQTVNGLQALGLSPEESMGVAQLNPQLQREVIKNYLEASSYEGLESAIGALGATDIPGRELSDSGELPAEMPEGLSQLTPLQQQLGIPEPPAEIPLKKRPIVENKRIADAAATMKGRKPLAEILKSPRLSPEQRLKVAALEQRERLAEKKAEATLSTEERKALRDEQREAQKDTKAAYDEINKKAKSAKESSMRLERMQTLLDKGKLSSPAFNSFIKMVSHGFWGVGFDLNFLLGANDQEFQKLSMDFMKNVKDIFGARVTTTEVEMFLKTLPTLAQTHAGKQRVINNLNAFDDAARIRKKAMTQVIKQNKGRRPFDLEEQVDAIADPQLDALARKFKKSYGPIRPESISTKVSNLVLTAPEKVFKGIYNLMAKTPI